MKYRILVVALALSAIFIAAEARLIGTAHAQQPAQQQIGVTSMPAPIYLQPAHAGGVIEVGQALGPALQPYVDSIVQACVALLISWVLWLLKSKFNVNIDEGHRKSIQDAVQRQAASLVADGFVKIEQGGKVRVDNQALAQAGKLAVDAAADAVRHFNMDPNQLAARIVDALPHVPAVAEAQANALKPA